MHRQTARRRTRVRGAWLVAFAFVCLGTATVSRSEVTEPTTPQAALRLYLEAARAGDYTSAARHLDLRGLPPSLRDDPPRLARQLKVVLDRTLWVDLESLSNEPDGARDDGLPPSQDLVGTIALGERETPVLVSRSGPPEGARVWRISTKTLAQVPELYGSLGATWIEEQLPESMTRVRVLELELWQWLGLLALALISGAAAFAAVSVGLMVARVASRRRGVPLDDRVAEIARGPLRAFVAVLVFAAGQSAFGLPVPVSRLLRGTEQVALLMIATWLLTRSVDVAASNIGSRMASEGRSGAVSIVSLGSRVARLVLWALAAVALIQNLGFDVTALFAGIGLGGLALALAAQKTVENLFGGLTLLVDQPVRVGDFCRFGGRVGTVEEVGLRSTRVRTLDRTLVTIPNGEFAALQLENFTHRDRIWLQATLGLRYETTPDQLRCVLEDLRELLRSDSSIDRDSARVRFVGFGAYSLDLEVFAYVRVTDFAEFLRIREEIYLKMMDVIAGAGSGFAFPSQTIYGAPDTGIDAERARAAEARVRD